MPAPNNQASFGQKFAWGMGGFADFVMANTIVYLAMPIYNLGLGVSAALVGLALGLPRILDAFTDPFIGNMSDNTRSRWGRRRPYILIGAILSGPLYAAIWMPPKSFGETELFLYFLIMSLVFFLAYTIFVVPHSSLGFEMSTDSHERTRIFAFRTFFYCIASLLTPWIYWLSLRPIFGGNEVVGVRYIGVIIGLVIIGFGIVPAIFCRENPQTQSQPKIAFLSAAKHTISTRPFLAVTGILLIVLMACNIVVPFGMYINIYYVCEGNKDFASTLIGLGMTTGAVLTIVSLRLITYVSSRFGKKTCLVLGQMTVLISYLSSFYLYTPQDPYLQLISAGLAGLGLQWVCLLTVSMMTDCCDLDDVKTGLRREGMYQAMFNFAVKTGIGGASAISGLMLTLSGFGPKVTPSVETILNMRLLYAFSPVLFIGIGLVLTWLYPLNDRRMREIRLLLDARNSSATSASRSELIGEKGS